MSGPDYIAHRSLPVTAEVFVNAARLLCVTILLLAACRAPRPSDEQPPVPPPAKGNASWVVTPSAFGKVHIGWTVAELNAALGDSLKPTYEISEECDQLAPSALPPGTSLMVLQDTVVRVDVDSTGILTPEGTGVGDTEARLREVYGARAVVTPHKYTGPAGHYVTVIDPADSNRMTIFETDGRNVLQFRAGMTPGVLFVEGCA